jgi:hypothetical protein
MKKFFAPNLDARGRWLRGGTGGVLVISGLVLWASHFGVAVALFLAGGFCLLESGRGWCVVRACGIKTRL